MGSVRNRHHDPKGRARTKTPNIFVDLSKQKIAERRKAMLDQFQAFNPDVTSLDELMALSAFGKSLAAEYEARKIKAPEYVAVQNDAISRQIDTLVRDQRAARVRHLKAEREGLKTAAEKRDAIEKELAELEAVGS